MLKFAVRDCRVLSSNEFRLTNWSNIILGDLYITFTDVNDTAYGPMALSSVPKGNHKINDSMRSFNFI